MNQKKIFISLALLSGMANASLPDNDLSCASHVYVPRSASTDLVWIDALNLYNRFKNPKKYYYNSATIYQQSRKSKELGAAFLLGTSNELNAVEGGGAGVANSLELGLANPATPFDGTLSIRPERKQFTYIGNLYFDFSDYWCGLWGDFTWGITNAHHRLNCCQTGNEGTICPGVATISDALSQDSLSYSKFYCDNCHDGKRRTGFEDVQLRLGLDYTWCGDNHFSPYIIGTIPAGRRATAEYIFEPLVGSKHGSIGGGFIADYTIDWCGCGDDSSLVLLSDFNYRFVFKHDECRTFDLIPNGPFSRYILVVDQANPGLPFQAANITTSRVKVAPRSTIQWWVGLNYEYCNWDFEVGYNLFWRQKERFKGDCIPLPTTVGIYNLNGCGISSVTASNATMTDSGTADAVFVGIPSSAINVDSGLAGRVLSNKVYGALSWTGCACDCFEWMAGFGASYEFVSKHDRCNALQNWAVFGKWAVGF
jgi:hypothetical protein